MKSKRKILPLAISALLMMGAANYPMPGYADDNKSSDSDKRSDSGSGDKSSQKITICHVPPGNPEQMHTIHIAFSAWKAHKAHINTNDKGLPLADYLGSCNNPPIRPNTPPTTTTTTKETLHVISGCTGTYRDALATKVQSYFEPITVADTVLDDKSPLFYDESVVTAMSQCLDKGDSSDSGKSKADSSKSISGGKGGGRDSVSDSGNHHRIRGCQNKDTEHKADSSKHGLSDSDKDDNNKNYHQKLKSADSVHDAAQKIKDPIVVSDSSLDDDGVWKEYKECAKDAGDQKKIDSSKTGKQKGDSGHKQHILKSCVDDSGDALRKAIVKYKEKPSTKNIILTETSYTDVSIKQAVEDCVDPDKGKGKDNTVTTSLTITGATITNATITNAVITDGKITDGKISAGTSSDGNVIGGTITTGTVTGGTTAGTTITGATVTGATVVFTGVSGRLNVREDTSPK